MSQAAEWGLGYTTTTDTNGQTTGATLTSVNFDQFAQQAGKGVLSEAETQQLSRMLADRAQEEFGISVSDQHAETDSVAGNVSVGASLQSDKQALGKIISWLSGWQGNFGSSLKTGSAQENRELTSQNTSASNSASTTNQSSDGFNTQTSNQVEESSGVGSKDGRTSTDQTSFGTAFKESDIHSFNERFGQITSSIESSSMALVQNESFKQQAAEGLSQGLSLNMTREQALETIDNHQSILAEQEALMKAVTISQESLDRHGMEAVHVDQMNQGTQALLNQGVNFTNRVDESQYEVVDEIQTKETAVETGKQLTEQKAQQVIKDSQGADTFRNENADNINYNLGSGDLGSDGEPNQDNNPTVSAVEENHDQNAEENEKLDAAKVAGGTLATAGGSLKEGAKTLVNSLKTPNTPSDDNTIVNAEQVGTPPRSGESVFFENKEPTPPKPAGQNITPDGSFKSWMP